MAKTESTMLPLGTIAPDFALPDAAGRRMTRDEAAGPKGLLVLFLCNHCPYVQLIADRLAVLTADFMQKGLGVVAINANDFEKYPDDAPDKMRAEAAARGYRFPYLVDESQDVAKAYKAACTPDLYLFNSKLKLVYRGQFDGARPGNGIAVTGEDLARAVSEVVQGRPVGLVQKPSIGCNIKWRPGNEPDYR